MNKEKSLLLFTLASQTAVGAFWTLGALSAWIERYSGAGEAARLFAPGWDMVALLMALALAASFFHLGAPLSAWRALTGFFTSWLSREVIFAVLFTGSALLFVLLPRLGLGDVGPRQTLFWIAALLGLALVYTMSRAYRLRTVPAWDTWITTVSFFMTAALLGALAVAGLLLAGVSSSPVRGLLRGLVLWAALLLANQLILLPLWLSHLTGSQAAQASYERITQEYGRVLRLREALALMAIVTLSIGLLFGGARSTTVVDIGVWLAILLAVVSEILGRALFYAARVRHGI